MSAYVTLDNETTQTPERKSRGATLTPKRALPVPDIAITIAIDCAYAVATGGGLIETGIYMFDNQLTSEDEGGTELNTFCHVDDLIGFNAVPINPYHGDSVAITGFQVEPGATDVFTSNGYPEPQPSGEWIGQALQDGSMTYQIKVAITHGLLHPVTVYAYWDPFITCAN